MADISHIKGPDNTSYDIKDATARSDLTDKISRSGDTMTGSLRAIAFTALAAGSPKVSSQSTDIDASKADNNVSTDHYPGLETADKFGRILTRTECVASSNGNIAAYWYVRNYDTSGSPVAQKGIKITMAKDGSITYNVDDSSKFRTAIDALCKSGDTMTGTLTIPSVGGMWVQGRDADKNAINVAGQANNNQTYDGILWNKCYNGNYINIGRIGNELDIGYIEASQTDNSLRKFVKFAPAEDKLKFGDSGQDKSYIKLSDGGFYGNWNGITLDMNTSNTTDTWVPVQTGSKWQHRAIPTDYNDRIIGDSNHAASTGAALSADTGRIGVHWYSQTGKIANQPTQYGFLLTCATAKGSAEQHSIFMEQANGSLYHMGTNGSSSGSPPAYKKIYDSGNLVPTDLSYTRVNGNVSNDAKCRRYGNIVEFTGQFGLSSSSLARDTILWNGFPKPKTVVYFTARCEGNWNTYSFYISTNGEIKNQQASIPAGTYNCNLVYICQ